MADQTTSVTVRLPIKVVPGSSRDSVEGWLGDTLKVRVTAPPERGKANAAVEKLVARVLGLPTGSTRVVAGHTSARKLLEIDGPSEAEIHDRLPSGHTPAERTRPEGGR